MGAFSQRQSSRLDERVRHSDLLGRNGYVELQFHTQNPPYGAAPAPFKRANRRGASRLLEFLRRLRCRASSGPGRSPGSQPLAVVA